METKLIALMIFLLSLFHLESALAQSSSTNPAQLETEEETWEYFEALCQEQPTRRCENDRMARVRNGEIVLVPTYDVDTAYRTRNEMVEQVLREKELKEGGG